MPRLRVESGFSMTIPSNVVQALRLRVGQSVEVRFPEMPLLAGRGLGTATQWWHLSNQRLEDVQVLLASRKKRYNGAVYLGGYAVECALKAAICALKNLPSLPTEYKTNDLEELLAATGLTLPHELAAKFRILKAWSVDLRYQTQTWDAREAREFLTCVKEVKQWIDISLLPR